RLVRVRGFVAAISAEAANNSMIRRPSCELRDFQLMRTHKYFDDMVVPGCRGCCRITVEPCAGSTGTATARCMCWISRSHVAPWNLTLHLPCRQRLCRRLMIVPTWRLSYQAQ